MAEPKERVRAPAPALLDFIQLDCHSPVDFNLQGIPRLEAGCLAFARATQKVSEHIKAGGVGAVSLRPVQVLHGSR